MMLTKLQTVVIPAATIDHISLYLSFYILEKVASLELET